MIVIADTGPINYLILIGEIEVLPALYGRVLVPPSVCEELKRLRAPEAVRRWIGGPPAWLEVRAPSKSTGGQTGAAPISSLLRRQDCDSGRYD